MARKVQVLLVLVLGVLLAAAGGKVTLGERLELSLNRDPVIRDQAGPYATALRQKLGSYAFDLMDDRREQGLAVIVRSLEWAVHEARDVDEAAELTAAAYRAIRAGMPAIVAEGVAVYCISSKAPASRTAGFLVGLGELAGVHGFGARPGDWLLAEELVHAAVEGGWSQRRFDTLKRALIRAVAQGHDASAYLRFLMGQVRAGASADKAVAMAIREFRAARKAGRAPRMPEFEIGARGPRLPGWPARPDPDEPWVPPDKLAPDLSKPHTDKPEFDPGRVPTPQLENPLPMGTVKAAGATGIQPGWIRVYFDYSANVDPSFQLEVSCQDPSKQGSVVSEAKKLPKGSRRGWLDLRLNEAWMEAQGLAKPCTITAIEVKMSIGKGIPSSSVLELQAPMDVPLAFLHPGQLSFPATGATEVSLQLPWYQRRHVAYPPMRFAIESAGRVAFVEVEELAARDAGKSSVGLRGLVSYSTANNVVFELGAGAELFDGWGIDIERLGVTRDTTGVQESHPGFAVFTAPKILPAPPVWTEQDYLAAVLDNKKVHRCWAGDDCLDVIYDEAAHKLHAVGGAKILSLDPGPVQPFSKPQLLDPWEDKRVSYRPLTDGLGELLRGRSLPTLKAGRSAAGDKSAKREDEERGELIRRLDRDEVLRVRRAVLRGSKGRLDPEPILPRHLREDSPEEQIPPLRDARPLPPPGTPLIETGAAKAMAEVGPISHCAGLSGPFRCPTVADQPAVGDMPRAPGGLEMTVLDYLPPQYAKRYNARGTCGTHASLQFYETLVNRYADDLAERRIVLVDGEAVPVPEPRIATSVMSNLATRRTNLFQSLGGEKNEWTALPQFADAYWPVRECHYRDWADRTVAEDDGAWALAYCSGHLCNADSECPGVCIDGHCEVGGDACTKHSQCHGTCTDGACLHRCAADADCPAGDKCISGFCLPDVNCGQDSDCPDPDRHHCKGGRCWSNDRFWGPGYCVGQGQPPPGIYRNFSHMWYNAWTGADPASLVPWSLANTPFPVEQVEKTSLVFATWADARPVIQHIVAEIDKGLPVYMAYYAGTAEVDDNNGGQIHLKGERTWYLPPELGWVSREDLKAAFARKDGHAVLLVGYSIAGSLNEPDPYNSFFVVENNWGKSRGFYYMTFAAFTFLAYEIQRYRLAMTCGSAACAQYTP